MKVSRLTEDGVQVLLAFSNFVQMTVQGGHRKLVTHFGRPGQSLPSPRI